MRRFLVLVMIAVAAALTVYYAIRHTREARPETVAALLPSGTVFLLHLPDFNLTREQWRGCELYQLYREPAVQDFLQRPLAKLRQRDITSETLRDIGKLAPKDAFIGLTAIAGKNPKAVAGFRFSGSRTEAEKIIGKWRAELAQEISSGPSETILQGQDKIEIAGTGLNRLATVYHDNWFFASNDLEELKALLDRTGRHPGANPSLTLDREQNFRAALGHAPPGYALLFYLQPKALAEKLASYSSAGGQQSGPQRATLEHIRGICGTTRFDHGKIHDLLFVAMPKLAQTASLTRSSLALGTKDTFFYLATLLSRDQLAGLNQANGISPWAGWLHKFVTAASRNDITLEDWSSAFDLELGSLADWPSDVHWPSLILTLPVRDVSRARKVVNGLTSAIDEDGIWRKTEKNGVQYFSVPWGGFGNLIAGRPTIALSDARLVAGLDPISVEQAMARSQHPSSELAKSAVYKSAAAAVPDPTNFFSYVDVALLYSRLDASVRPLLLMGAAFMPAISERIDVNKLPPPDVVTKHLTPIVSSQRYEGDGYVSESIGPITLNQAIVVVGVPVFLWLGHYNSALW